jgi:NADH-quinone oxidoreductase subunit N
MNLSNLYPLLPFIIVSAASLIVMLGIAFYRSHYLTLMLTLSGLIAAMASLLIVTVPKQVTSLLVIDGYALFFMALILIAGIVVALLSYGYLEGRGDRPEEFYVLLLLAVLGSVVLVSSRHFASFFLGLETLNISLYALIAYRRKERHCVEAGVKYLILAASSDAFMLFGIALIYADLGSLEFARMAPLQFSGKFVALSNAGLAMVLTGFGFKLAVAPFHFWTPDVYQGAPAPVTAFVATVSKGAVFAVMFRYLAVGQLHTYFPLFLVFHLISVASMFVGNLLALFQDNVKRILAYSSIAHMGYLLVAFLAAGPLAATAVAFYFSAYFVTTLGAFGVITVLSGKEKDAASLEDYRGLFWRRPWLAGTFTAMLLSLAGIPLTAGFIGKFFVMSAGVGSALWVLVTSLVLNSVIGLFYYVRIIVVMYSRPPVEESTVAVRPSRSLAGGVVLAVLLVLLLWLGVYPNPFIQIIQAAVNG